MSDIIHSLNGEHPEFHLKSQTAQVPNAEDFFFKNGSSQTERFFRTSYAIGTDVLRYIQSNLTLDSCTMETGAGNSTVVFASKVKRHICINPDITSNRMIEKWILEHGYSSCDLKFIETPSDIGLPTLSDIQPQYSIDMALIDGSHSFPFPIIDWHFIDKFLKIDGKLLIDDIQINSVRLLSDLLDLEPSYKKIEKIGNCIVFQKIVQNRSIGWLSQEINKRKLVWFD